MAGEQGARQDGTGYRFKEQRLSWPALLRLRDYKPEPLMEESQSWETFSRYKDIYRPEQGTYPESKPISYAQITAAGARFYEVNREKYEALYGESN